MNRPPRRDAFYVENCKWEFFDFILHYFTLITFQCVCVLSTSSQGTVGVCDLLERWRCWSICFILVLGCLPICTVLMSRVLSYWFQNKNRFIFWLQEHRNLSRSRRCRDITVIQNTVIHSDKQGAVKICMCAYMSQRDIQAPYIIYGERLSYLHRVEYGD